MKNPCSECLVKVNCTQICPDKKNFKILLQNALTSYVPVLIQKPGHHKMYALYKKLDEENNSDMVEIRMRRLRIGREQN